MGIDEVLRKPIVAGLIPGIVALAADDRGVFYEGAFGSRAVDKSEPMTTDSVFRIASMTKAVTGAAVMQLVAQGLIGLARPMGDILPLVKNVKVLEGFLRATIQDGPEATLGNFRVRRGEQHQRNLVSQRAVSLCAAFS